MNFNPLFPLFTCCVVVVCLFIQLPPTAVLAKVTGRSRSTNRKEDARYNIVIHTVFKNAEGRNLIASSTRKTPIQLVVPASSDDCRCQNLKINR